MSRTVVTRIAVGVVAGTLLVGAGAAAGASSASDDFLADVAKRLGVSQDKLEQAILGARVDQLDRAVAKGLLTRKQADALEERLRSGKSKDGGFGGPGSGFGAPGSGLGGGFGFGPGGHGGPGGPGRGFGGAVLGGLDAAAKYLGVTRAELLQQLAGGKSLADVAKAKGKSTDGLAKAIVADQKQRLADAVKAGRLTQARADELGKRISDAVDDLVQRAWRMGDRVKPSGGGFGFGGPQRQHGQAPAPASWSPVY